ncbi:MAG TPA: cytochrome c maturation protein CcmE [Oceanicaulis sp.]|uniref:Cytochrome c-type biogenesis protein CcmE n=1 Tax=Glycocaulis albus TaxID=1382801 RepID=A0ABQ1XQ86_9PROT|nr:cytochrome c maturation protein CcmE [Glycocaulis albus]MBV5257451.1 cytochrome c maturation protein CcmE [Synechococcus moorigangaii CMS01]GGH00037.1 cytochrome c-type biogenesis protein CcmE [Glycocaulis albus]HCY55536.1 cytochrome c maturation protein CcmE [Oceanicaulis sp.]
MIKARKRLWVVLASAGVLVAAGVLAGFALRDAMTFFHSPAMVAESPPLPGQRIRVGGLVIEGSVERPASGGASFSVTDTVADIRITYAGSLPDLFREGQGIVAEGAFEETGLFVASRVLAKHDEAYMPPEVASALASAEAQGALPGSTGRDAWALGQARSAQGRT